MKHLEKGKLVFQQYVGTADAEDGLKVTLTQTLHGEPIITFADDNRVIFDWEWLIGQAVDFKANGFINPTETDLLKENKILKEQIEHLQASVQGYTHGCEGTN